MGEKQSRFLLRISEDDRRVFEDVARSLGLASISDAVRFVMREKYRELFPADTPRRKKRAR